MCTKIKQNKRQKRGKHLKHARLDLPHDLGGQWFVAVGGHGEVVDKRLGVEGERLQSFFVVLQDGHHLSRVVFCHTTHLSSPGPGGENWSGENTLNSPPDHALRNVFVRSTSFAREYHVLSQGNIIIRALWH